MGDTMAISQVNDTSNLNALGLPAGQVQAPATRTVRGRSLGIGARPAGRKAKAGAWPSATVRRVFRAILSQAPRGTVLLPPGKLDQGLIDDLREIGVRECLIRPGNYYYHSFPLAFLSEARPRPGGPGPLEAGILPASWPEERPREAVAVIKASSLQIVNIDKDYLDGLPFKREEVIGKTCPEMAYHSRISCTYPNGGCPLLETLKTGQSVCREEARYSGDGIKTRLEVCVYPLRHSHGQILQVLQVIREIPEDEAAERAAGPGRAAALLGRSLFYPPVVVEAGSRR